MAARCTWQMRKLDDILKEISEEERESLCRSLIRRGYGRPRNPSEWYRATYDAFLEISHCMFTHGGCQFYREPLGDTFKVTTNINGWTWFLRKHSAAWGGDAHLTINKVWHERGWEWDLEMEDRKIGRQNLLGVEISDFRDLSKYLDNQRYESAWRQLHHVLIYGQL